MHLLPYILGALTLIILGFQLFPYLKIRGMRGQDAPSLSDLLSAEQQKQPRMLLYFMAPQCGMCRDIPPIVDDLAEQRPDIFRVDASEDPETARQFKVMGTPAFVLVDKGVIEKVKLGGMTRNKIIEMIES